MSENINDKEMLRIMKDPVTWAEHHIKSEDSDSGARWYQQEILRHPHNRMVLRCGRRVGKCIEGSQRVLNIETGEYKSIHELYVEKNHRVPIYSMRDDFKIRENTSFSIEDNGMKEVFKVRTKLGNEVQVTGNHPLLTIDGWKEVDLLKKGDFIGTPKSEVAFGKESDSDEYLKLFGYLSAVGTLYKGIISIEIKQDFMLEELNKISEVLKIKLVKKSKRTYFLIEEDDHFKNLLDFENRRIPEKVFRYNKESLQKYMAALCDSTGWISATIFTEFGIGSVNHEFLKDLKHLFLRFAIQTNIVKRIVKGNDYAQIMIHRNTATRNLLEQITIPYSNRDFSELEAQAFSKISKDYTVPKDIWPYVEKVRLEKRMSKNKVVGSKDKRLRYTLDVTEERLNSYADNLQDIFIKDIANSDILWDEIESIENVGMKQTYDVYVPETHNLIVEDIMVHNTWTMAVHMLWVAFTCNGGTVPTGATCVVATPYDNQARLIFDQLMTFIRNNEILNSSVKSSTKNPYIITWNNGSVIKLFTAGTKSGGEGGALRGQKADWLYMDKLLCPLAWRRALKTM